MNEIKCPNCGTVFQVDESQYHEILQQVRNEEYDKEIKELENRYKKDKEQELEIIKNHIEQEHSKDISKKNEEILNLKNELKNQETTIKNNYLEEINKQKNQQSEINSQIDEAKEKQKEIESKKSETMKQVESISSQIENYETQIDSLDSQISEANAKIKEQEQKLAQAEEDYKKQEELIKQRMVAIYVSGETSYLDVLLSSKSLTDFISSYYLVSELTKMDTELLEKIEKQKEEIETAKKEIETSKQDLVTAKASKESVSAELKTAKSEKSKYVSQLSDQEKELEQEIQELKQANAKIASEIKAAEAKYQKQLEELRRQEESKNNNNSNNGGNSTSTGSGYFMRPVSGGSISTNGYYSSGKFHGAIDYAVSSGSPVYAAAAGVVMSTANLSGSYGTYVVIRHANGLQSYYAHGTYGSICVSPGQTVSKGQQIMLSGSTGNSSGPHLHFEVRTSPYSYNGYATGYGQDSRVNPANYM